MAIKTINTLDGKQVKLNTNFSLRTFLLGQEKGLIEKNFMMQMMKASQGGEPDMNAISMEDASFFNIPYLAYINYPEENIKMSYEEFMDKFPLDVELIANIFAEILTGMQGQKESKLQENFKKATPKSSNKSKKKYRR